MDTLTAEPALSAVPALLGLNSDVIAMINDRIDLLLDRTAGVRIPRDNAALPTAEHEATGARYVDELAHQNERLWGVVQRLDTMLSELEV